MSTLDVAPAAPESTAALETSPSPRLGTRRAGTHRHAPVWLVLFALALGGFGIGTTEFVSMGLLPNIASDVHVSVPTAGYAISAYALGVVVGAPMIAVLAARISRRTLLIALMAAFVLGNGASAIAPNYATFVLARFVAGLPHGAYFGVAALVAASLVGADRRSSAVGKVMLGLSVANVAGVPAATALGQHLGWRSAYVAVVLIGLATVLALMLFAPAVGADTGASRRGELMALRTPQVVLTLAVGTVGFGGMFAVYSYITPTLTRVAGLPERWVPAVLVIYGLGMVIGNVAGARLVDRRPMRSMVVGIVITIGLSALFPVAAHNAVLTTLDLAGMSIAATTVVIGLQTRLMDVAGQAQTLAAAMNHAALNMANALGAWLGGVVISLGWGYQSTGYVGVVLGILGLGLLLVGTRNQWMRPRRSSVQTDRPAELASV